MICKNSKSNDRFIFSGNQHESVPRALFFDKRLTPLERNAWQVIRISLASDGLTAMPSYEELRRFLASMPYIKKASSETIARALTILRLTRWLSLVRKRRAPDGTCQSNLYVLHDEPLLPFEAMRIDDDYLVLICNSINHASKAVRQVALGVLDDIANDSYLSGKKLPTRLEVLLGRIDKQVPEKLSTGHELHESEDGKNNRLRNCEPLDSESEAGLKPAENQPIRNPKQGVSNSISINILLQKITANFKMPERFYTLKPNQQKGILQTIQYLPIQTQQQIFCEWDKRCHANMVRKPAGYLFGIAQKALRGELNDFFEEDNPAPPTQKEKPRDDSLPSQESYISTDEERLKIQEHIRNLKHLVSVSKSR